MTKELYLKINELKQMKIYPENLFFRGDLELLKKRKIGIVGSRRPNKYAAMLTHKISNELAKRDIAIVSGGAMGVDAIAHKACDSKNAIAVVANGLDIKYPSINKNLLCELENNGLIISAYKDGEKARKYTFVHRNEIVVALSEALIVTHADEKSGTLTSIKYALEMGKKIYTIPHQLGESIGTQKLVSKGLIEAIFDLDDFFDSYGEVKKIKDTFLDYCNTNPEYDEAIKKYSQQLFEYELEGKISIKNGKVYPI